METPFLLIKLTLFLLIIGGTSVNNAISAKILFLLPIATHPQTKVFGVMIKALALEGHDVTVISPVAIRGLPTSVKEIHPVSLEELGNELRTKGKTLLETREELKSKNHFLPILWNTSAVDFACHKLYNDAEINYLMKGFKRFDLAIVNAIQNECVLGLAHYFKVPHMYLVPSPLPNYISSKFGHYFPLSFVPSPYTAFGDNMNFLERCVNFVVETGLVLVTQLYLNPHYEEIYREYLGQDTPSIEEIDDNVGVMLVYSNSIMNYPMPLPPNIIEVGGMHCHIPRPLPTELDKFLKEAEFGFIYFSLGSIIESKDVPDELFNIFITTFSNMDERVIWKWDKDIPNLPPNILVGSWLPQQDILGHPNIKLFISNGDLLNSQEAICHSVPMLGIPFTGEHDLNMEQAEKDGYALTWEVLSLNQTHFVELIEEMLRKPRFRGRVKQLSKMYKDTSQNALEKAIYWTDHVLRNKGAPHLRSPSKDLNYFEYHSFDVIAFLLTILFLIFYILYIFTFKIISSCCLRSKGKGDKVSTERQNGSISHNSHEKQHEM